MNHLIIFCLLSLAIPASSASPSPSPSPPQGGVGVGEACGSSDVKAYVPITQVDASAMLLACGTPCIAVVFKDTSCVSKCVAKQIGLSTNCSACFGVFSTCVAKGCLMPCLAGDTAPACGACVESKCAGNFNACTSPMKVRPPVRLSVLIEGVVHVKGVGITSPLTSHIFSQVAPAAPAPSPTPPPVTLNAILDGKVFPSSRGEALRPKTSSYALLLLAPLLYIVSAVLI